MKNKEKSPVMLLNDLSDKLKISKDGLNLDKVKKIIEKIKEIEKSNTIYQQQLQKLIKSKDEKIKLLRSENTELKHHMKDYIATRMMLLNYSRESISGLENQTETNLLIKHKKLIDNHMNEHFRLSFLNGNNKQERTNYQPFKLKEVRNGN